MQRILLVAVIALSINALAGFANFGSASTKPVEVVSGIYFTPVVGATKTVTPGNDVSTTASCPKKSDYAISSGFHVSGSYFLALPTVTTFATSISQELGATTVVDPKAGGDADVTTSVVCAKITYAMVPGA